MSIMLLFILGALIGISLDLERIARQTHPPAAPRPERKRLPLGQVAAAFLAIIGIYAAAVTLFGP